jgi:hypothetical protein
MRLLAALLLVAACSKPDEAPLVEPPPLLPMGELKRAAEACLTYVVQVCKCAETVPAVKEECALSRGLPDAIDLAKRLALNPKADKEDARQAASSVRKTVKTCIESTAKLPSLGCP